MKKIKPVVKWKGSKQRLLDQIVSHLPDQIKIYIDPFFGSGAMRGYLSDVHSYCSDSNVELMNTYRQIRDNLLSLWAKLEEHRQKHSEEYYYQVRSLQLQDFDTISRAARFLYLNQTCFNGVWRVNQAGQNNVPKGDNNNPKWDYNHLEQWSQMIRRDTLWSCSVFDLAFEKLPKGSFVYFDPPYFGTSGYEKEFTWENHIRLGQLFAKLSDQGVNCMLSNSDTEHTRALFASYNLRTIYRNGTISVGTRTKQSEILVTNYDI
ncbi:MAG: Dam family site-specific DNA-(adenine-N6)-methyltransferase [Leptolyngbyaceae cyanobacterium SL_5_14]|nr:Dam family site-specific DNA-(adenine-N6)-methyltransferase [Leptolyngbyaceae cyanobacterium SL_5_14]